MNQQQRMGIDMFDDLHKSQNEQEELLIFGYSCKLFRDDEKAQYIERGEHLIPWMGNNDLMIDRFDVRGTLYDLSGAEAKCSNSQSTLSEAEMKMEQVCDEERYFALYYDETQYLMQQEEEFKRLQIELSNGSGGYNQLGLNYKEVENTTQVNTKNNPEAPPDPVTYNPSQDDEAFIPTSDLNIPSGMEVPSTVKQHKVIVKTARFVASHGAQMEILIKTKQAGSPMFHFLSFDNGLNAYYKHLVNLIKSGKYKEDEETESNSVSLEQNEQNFQSSSPSVRPDLTPGSNSSVTQSSPNCPYSKLTSKIKESQKVPNNDDLDSFSTSQRVNKVKSNGLAKQAAAVPGLVQSQGSSSSTFKGLVDYQSYNPDASGDYSDGDSENSHHHSSVKKKESIFDYSSIPWPPPEVQMVIDKMASYIIKNGPDFEAVVRSRKDPRMQFLEGSHMYNSYFNCKVQLYKEVYGDLFRNPEKLHEWAKKHQCASKQDNNKSNHGLRGISFSIKSREQEAAVTSHTTFPIESSTSEEDENMDEEERDRRKVARDKRRADRKIKAEKERKEREEYLKKERLRKEEELKNKMSKNGTGRDSSGDEDLYDIFKYAQDMSSNRVPDSDLTKDPSSNVRKRERKDKAAQFLSNISSTQDEKEQVIGPQLPLDIALELSRNYPCSPSPSSSSCSLAEKKPISSSPPTAPQSLPSSPSNSDNDDNDLKDKGEDSLKISGEEENLDGEIIPDDNSVTAVISSDEAEEEVGSLTEEFPSSMKVKKLKKRSRKRSPSLDSPSSRKSRSKRKKSHSEHKRKRRHSRSGSPSRRKSKSHRSSHKKKHSSHREKERNRKKKKRRRSPSVSSLPSSSDPSTPSTLPSDSDVEIQVIDLEDGKGNTEDSNTVSPKIGNSSSKNDRRTYSASPNRDILDEKSIQLSSLLIKKQKPILQSMAQTAKSAETANFNPSKSTAMAKIAQGLRAKLNAILEKESKIE